MVTPIDTKRGINPLRLGKGHEVQSTETRVGPTRQKGNLDGVIGPTRQMDELDGVAGPTRQMGKLDGVIYPTRPFGELDARPLLSSLYVEVIRHVSAVGILYGCRGKTTNARILAKRQILGSRIRVFDTMPRDVRDQCAGFRARPRSNHGIRGCDDYFDLRLPYHFRPDSIPL
ncbi:hypothetical protein YC2023_041101 [Brassica napus]